AWPSPPSSSFPSEKTIFVIHPCPIAQNHTSAMQKKPMKGFHTLCLHSGQTPESNRGHLTPIYATSTYTFETAEQSESLFEGKESGFVYGRFGNPNTFELESKMAALEAYGLEQSPGVPLSLYAV